MGASRPPGARPDAELAAGAPPAVRDAVVFGRPVAGRKSVAAARRVCCHPPVIDVPGPVREKARAAGADGWLADLPRLVAEIAREWGLTIGRAFPDATESLVVAADTADGRPAVLKLQVPRADRMGGDGLAPARHEIAVLRLVAGRGCVRLLRHDVDRGALLLDRLGPSLHDVGLPMAQRHEILCSLLLRFWRPAADIDADHGFPDGAQKARELAAAVARWWAELDRPCSERAVEHALACADRRAAGHDDERAVLVHGDPHEWNVLVDPRPGGIGWALADPEGLLAEPEYDLGVLMREDPADMLEGDPFARARVLAARTGRDATALWEWGVVERVSTGLLATRIGLQPVGRQMLAVADRVAGLGGP
ncbi:aminoglycoside phosphotransferase family protein [Pseudonocardia humida]|uniref:Phosphotransferase n=1 Tax=Pseudonocardia humida TaxID=2800819 RepID=A0ABT1A9C4_9PSEU|nr:aminoglycoside phosphotransferase family protein [Pseudonocardia humida]MCO1659617.1 phosphotransferase [Pseudonocardia humida]